MYKYKKIKMLQITLLHFLFPLELVYSFHLILFSREFLSH